MNAIPTHYNGINFRSRLEAKWARFFDLLGWNWDYEPLDFNGYIPDFYLHGDNPCFVEVKPAMKFNDLHSLNEKSHAVMSGTGKRVLYLGATIDYPCAELTYSTERCSKSLGLLVDFYDANDTDINPTTGEAFYPDEAYFVDCTSCGRTSFTGVIGGWSTHCCCSHEETHRTANSVLSLWKEATNTTQYNRIFYAGKG